MCNVRLGSLRKKIGQKVAGRSNMQKFLPTKRSNLRPKGRWTVEKCKRSDDVELFSPKKKIRPSSDLLALNSTEWSEALGNKQSSPKSSLKHR